MRVSAASERPVSGVLETVGAPLVRTKSSAYGRDVGSEEEKRLHQALLNRAHEAVEAAAHTVAESEVLAHVSEDLRVSGMTSRCAWCGRYRIGDRWLALERSPLIESSRSSHGICEDCTDSLREAGLSA